MCSLVSLSQLSINAGGCIVFLRDTAEVVDPALTFTQGRRHQVRREIVQKVTLCESGGAYISGAMNDCETPLAAALKTMVVGAEAATETTATAARQALPFELVHRICNFV